MRDESKLAADASSGDDDALTELLEHHGPSVRAAVEAGIPAKWRPVLEPDDVMQITYLEAFLSVRRFDSRGDGAFLGWLTRIANNNLLDAIRELERRKRPQPEQRVHDAAAVDSTFALLDQLRCTTTTPSRDAARSEEITLLTAAIARLPDDYGAVVRLYDLEGRPIGEVARALGRSEGAIYMLRARAFDHLREAMAARLGKVTPP